MTACWPLQMPMAAKAVLIALADNANDHGVCWPAIATIAKRVCAHERTVTRNIQWLESAGYLVIEHVNGRPSKYTITPTLDLFENENPRRKVTPGAKAPPAQDAKPPAESQGAPGAESGDPRQSATQTVKQEQKQEQEQKQPPAKKPPAAREPIPAPPEWVDREAWDGFAEMRKRKRAPLTARAAKLIFSELEKLRTKGHDPTAVLDQSTRNTWTDVYPIRQPHSHEDSSQGRKRSVVERIEANIFERRHRETATCASGAPLPARTG